MRYGNATVLALAFCLSAPGIEVLAQSQNNPPASGADGGQGEPYRTVYLRPGGSTEALLYEPTILGPKAGTGLVFSHPNRDNFNAPIGREMAERGYRVLTVNFRGENDYARGLPESYLPSISAGIAHLRSLPGVERVVLVGHSGGSHVGTLYQNVAENGPSACSGPEKIYPCPAEGLESLEKADGLVLLDPTLGAAHNMSAIDPALLDDGSRDPALDMFDPANGYDLDAKTASYSPEFARRFYAAQAARNERLVEDALARGQLISEGEGEFANDEPLVVRGVGVGAAGARLYQPDPSLAAHTKRPYLVLRADGTEEEMIIRSVRPASGQQVLGRFDELDLMNYATTVTRFLADSAIRTTPDYAFTEDDIVGIDWATSFTSTPSNAGGVTAPALVVSMTCHYLMVPAEIIFDRLGSSDKSYVGLEGAAHSFRACSPEYGDTTKRLFDFVDGWLSAEGRF